MANEEIPAETPEIDVDALDDAAFDALKSEMRSEKPAEAPPAPEPAADGQKDQPADEPAGDEDEPASDGIGKKQEFVPHAKFHQANERRKAAEQEAAKLRSDFNRLADRLSQLQQPATAQEAESEPEIPGDDDPLGSINWVKQQFLATQKQTKEQQAAQQQEQQTAAVLTAVNTRLEQDIADDPTVKDAHNALRKSYGMEFIAMGYTEQQALEAVNALERQHAMFMYQNNIPPGEYLKRLGAARGWQPKAPDSAPASEMTEAEKIAKREETRIAALSLGKGGGAVVDTGVTTPQQLLDMTDEEFAAYKKKHGSVSHAFRQAS